MFNKWMLEKELTDGVAALCETITQDTVARLYADRLDCQANIDGAQTVAKFGRTYAKIIVGSGVRYFVKLTVGDMVNRAELGTIYASASRNAPNFNRSFGTVFTINDFNWGAYEARPKPGTPWEMVRTVGPYATAVAK